MLVGAGVEGRHVAGEADAGGLVRVEVDGDLGAQELARRLIVSYDHERRRGAGGVLEADRVEGDAGVEDVVAASRRRTPACGRRRSPAAGPSG